MWSGISLWFWFAFPQWLMILSIFSCASWPFEYYLNPLSIYELGLGFGVVAELSVIYILWILILYQIYDLQIFSPILWVFTYFKVSFFFSFCFSPLLMGSQHSHINGITAFTYITYISPLLMGSQHSHTFTYIMNMIIVSDPNDHDYHYYKSEKWFSYCYFLINLFIYLFLFNYFWLCWVFVAAHRLSLVATRGVYSSLQCTGFLLRWLLLLWSTGSRLAGSVVVACGLQSAGSVVVAHGLSCSAACGIFPNWGSNLCPLHWQVDS